MTPGELDIQLTKPPEICFDLPFDTPGSILKSVHTSGRFLFYTFLDPFCVVIFFLSVRKSVRFNLLAKKRDSFSSFLSAGDTPSPLQVDEKSLDFENAGYLFSFYFAFFLFLYKFYGMFRLYSQNPNGFARF